MIVYDIFFREGFTLDDHSDGSPIWRGIPGETWVATVSNKTTAVDRYCQNELCVIRDREGDAAECEDLD